MASPGADFAGPGRAGPAARNWPPDGVSQLQLFLAGHRLAAGRASQPGLRRYRADPTVGVAGGMWDPARVQADRPDGAAVLARIDVGLRMPAGERVTVNVRSRSSRRTSVVGANVTMDGVTVLNQSWAGHDTITETV